MEVSFEGVLSANYPSSLPLRVSFSGHEARVCYRGKRLSCRSNTMFFKVCGVTPFTPFAFGVFWAQNRSLAQVRRTCTLQTTTFIDWICPWRTRLQKSALLFRFLRAHFENFYNYLLKNRNCILRLTIMSFSLRFCNAFKNYCKLKRKSKVWPKTLHFAHRLDSYAFFRKSF